MQKLLHKIRCKGGTQPRQKPLDVGGGPNLYADQRTFNGILPPRW